VSTITTVDCTLEFQKEWIDESVHVIGTYSCCARKRKYIGDKNLDDLIAVVIGFVGLVC